MRRPALRNPTLFTLTLLPLLANLTGCGAPPEPLNPGKVTAFVSVPPQAAIVTAIGGEHVVVEVLADAGKDPHDFSPSTRQTIDLGRAEVWFTTRMPFEHSMKSKVEKNAKRLKIIDTTAGAPAFPKSQQQPDHEDVGEAEHDHHDHHDHDHSHHHHDHSAGDPHLWLSPALLKTQAEIVAATLSELAPDHAADFETNLTAFTHQLDQLDAELRETLAPYHGATFLAYHGAFAWFADSYDLKQEVIEFSGKSPDTKRLRGIIERAKTTGIRVVFTQPQYDPNSAKAVAEGLKGSIVNIDPLAPDLFTNLRSIANELSQALATQADTNDSAAPAPATAE